MIKVAKKTVLKNFPSGICREYSARRDITLALTPVNVIKIKIE